MPDSHTLFFVCHDGDVACFETRERLAAFVEVYDIDKGFEFFDAQAHPLTASRVGRGVLVHNDRDGVAAPERLSQLLSSYFQHLPEKYHAYSVRAAAAATLDELVSLFDEFDRRPAPRGTWNKTVARLRR